MTDFNSLLRTKPLRLYPRGFLGSPDSPKTTRKPEYLSTQYNAEQGKLSFVRQDNAANPSNSIIDDLYYRMIRREPEALGFAYREQLLSTALDAFGTDFFRDWFLGQRTSPVYGVNHQDFLEDTLRFIIKGERQYPFSVWNTLVRLNDSKPPSGESPELSKLLFGNLHPYDRDKILAKPENQNSDAWAVQSNSTIAEILAIWTGHYRGFEDLVGTLYILFGSDPASN